MRAIQVTAPGGPEALILTDLPAPEPGPDEAVIEIAAAGVNFIDIYHRTGRYPVQLPFTPGQEGAGRVRAVGSDVHDVSAGERVAWANHLGGYAELARVPAHKLVRLPDGVAERDAAAVLLQGMTAHYLAYDTFPLRAGHVAVVHAGAGGVGLLLTQMARRLGATVITTVSTEEKAHLSRDAGAHHVIRYTEQDFPAEIRRLTAGRGADVVYDSVGKTTFAGSLASLRPRGMLVLYGGSSGPVPPFDPMELSARGSLFLTRPTIAHHIADRQALAVRATAVLGWVADGGLQVRIGGTYPLGDAARAHRDLEQRKTTGKLLLIPRA